MKILIVVGTFPLLSESFIIRKVLALAHAGYHIIVAARDLGDTSLLHDYMPLPVTLQIITLVPDGGWSNSSRLSRLVKGTLYKLIRFPRKSFLLWSNTDGKNINERLREYARYVGFIGLNVDIIHFEFLTSFSLYNRISLLFQVPMVVSCRGSDLHLLEQRNPLARSETIRRLQSVHAIHCVSQEMASELFRLSGRTQGIYIIRPAVPTSQIYPKIDGQLESYPLILAVGRLVWIKGYDYLLEAFARMKRAGIEFRAEIIGDGPLYTELRFSINDLDLEAEVKLLGSLSTRGVLERMQKADIVVLSSHSEGISNAVLEAMASGISIVTTDAGGMSEVVRDGIDGFIVPIRNILALTKRLTDLVHDPQLRSRMGNAARERVEAHFSLERQVKEFDNLYSEILKCH